jgi:hypothetical protein
VVGSRAGLAAIEAIIDASGIAPAIEALLPAGVRHRQLSVRTLLTGMMLALDDRRPAHLTEARAALTPCPTPTRRGWASPRTGTAGRTSSRTGKPSTPSAWS